MKKIFTKRLFIYMLAAFLVTITAIFVLQTVIIQRSNSAASQTKLEDVKGKLASNEENVKRLTDNLSEDNLAKTRAFADMLAVDPSIAKDKSKLDNIKDRLMVNELHIIDEKGIITSSTIDSYVGFDMTSGEQSNAFMVIVDDPSIEIAQEPQVNVAEGVVMQYIGVARTDAKGLVQVGVRPEVLENMLASTEINEVMKDIDFGEKGYVYAIDAKDGKILAHKESSLIGKSAEKAGFPKDFACSGKAVVNGVKGYYQAEAFGVAVADIEKASKDVKVITDMVRGNMDIVSDAVGKMGRISDVVEKNVQISQNTKQVSSNMADVAGKLLELVE